LGGRVCALSGTLPNGRNQSGQRHLDRIGAERPRKARKRKTMGSVIGYVGLSHLGIVSSAATAAKGFATVAYDADAALCQSLESDRLPIHEPGLADLLSEHRQRLTFTADASRLRECDVVIVALDIPTDDHGASKLQALDQLIASVQGHLNPNAVVVVLSQVC